jgi:hypothetical protein
MIGIDITGLKPRDGSYADLAVIVLNILVLCYESILKI